MILLLLVAMAVLLELPRRRPGSSSLELVEADISSIASVEISQSTSTVTLKKTGDGWTVSAAGSAYPPDTARMSGALATLAGMNGEIVSVNPENHALFGVDTLGGVLVTLRDRTESALASLVIGKPSRDFTGTYVRQDFSDEVCLVTGFIRSYLRPDVDFYRNRAILDFDESELETLKLVYPDESLTFARDTLGVMVLASPRNASFDSASVKQAISTLSRLNATGFDDDATPEQTGLEVPRFVVILSMSSGKTDTIQVGNTKDNSYYVKRSGDPVTYLLAKPATDRFFKNRGTYLGR